MHFAETLRLWPPALMLDRVCVKPYIIEPVHEGEKPVHLQKGDTIWIPTVSIQRDEKYYPNPLVFDPERFNDENKSKIDPYTYTPFGVGPRNCIGSRFALLEIKIICVHLLSKFEFVATNKTQIPLELTKAANLLAVDGGMWIGLKCRE